MRVLAIAALAFWTGAAAAQPLDRPGAPPRASNAEIGAATSAPFGWVDFCQRYDGECVGPTLARDLTMTKAAWRDLGRVNATVNADIEALSDMDHWGKIEQWDYPSDGKGDCEDLALLKRRMLAALGYPLEALLLTVVKDKKGEGHAVLTVRSDHGDFVLDNLDDAVKPWKATGYRFVKRQSQSDPNTWVAIGAPTPAPAYVSR